MGQALQRAAMDRAAYLEWEAGQPTKHEYLCGEVFAMIDVRRDHALVAGALFARFREALKGGPCQTFVADMKLLVAAPDAYFYPDVMVTCDPRDRQAQQAIEHPSLVVEVLSESTAAFDRGEKFAAYRRLPSLVEYLLVDIDARRLELYRRDGPHWLLLEANAEEGGSLHLASVQLELHPDQAFEDLD